MNLPTATSKRGETDDGNRPIYLLGLRVRSYLGTGNVGVALDREKLADDIRQISQPIAEVAARRGVSPKQ